jgi:hypothetical protein
MKFMNLWWRKTTLLGMRSSFEKCDFEVVEREGRRVNGSGEFIKLIGK